MTSQAVTVIVGSVGLMFFASLAGYSYYRGGRERRLVPGAVLISIASLNMLIRGVFFPNLSPSAATLGGFLRVVNGSLAVIGAFMLEREWRRHRTNP